MLSGNLYIGFEACSKLRRVESYTPKEHNFPHIRAFCLAIHQYGFTEESTQCLKENRVAYGLFRRFVVQFS